MLAERPRETLTDVPPGSLVRIGPNDLVTDDADILRRMNALRSPYVRSDWYNATAFSHELNHAFCETDERRHNELRNKLIPGVRSRQLDRRPRF